MRPQIIDLSPRISGKTRRAVNWLKQHPKGVLVVRARQVAEDLASLEQYKLTKDDVRRITTFTDILVGNLDFRPTEIYIDDADCLLASIVRNLGAGVTLAGFAMSNSIMEQLDTQLRG